MSTTHTYRRFGALLAMALVAAAILPTTVFARPIDGPGMPHPDAATGSDPVVPPVPGLQGLEGVWTNREATALTEVPRRLLVLGGGPVGLELGQALVRMGASVPGVPAS